MASAERESRGLERESERASEREKGGGGGGGGVVRDLGYECVNEELDKNKQKGVGEE